MTLAIDSSSPATATSTTATVTTASFTPPADSLLVILWAGNSHTATLNDGPPSITDNLGTNLPYTLSAWQSRADNPTVDGQAAAWWAPVTTSAAMTVSVTTGVNVIWTEKDAALKVLVITGHDDANPVGSFAGAGSSSSASVAADYVAQSTGGWGFTAICDWDALGTMTAGTGSTVISAGTITGAISYGFARRTSADDSNGATNTINVNLPGTSTNLAWATIEVLPAGQPPNTDPPGPFLPAYLTYQLALLAQAKQQHTTDPPPAQGPIIDPSSPAITTQTANNIPTLSSPSFTPPAGALLYIRMCWNTQGTENPSTPTITDSLGTPLTYTLIDWQSHADTPAVSGQAAHWYAFTRASTAMTVTVTGHSAGPDLNGGGALSVLVMTGVDPRTPIGAHGKGGSASAATINQLYTATRTAGQGFLGVCDWSETGAETPGPGCTLANGGSADMPGVISYAFLNRTLPDDTAADINSVGSALRSTSVALSWVYAEILPGAVVPQQPAAVRIRRGSPARRPQAVAVPPAQIVLTLPMYVPQGLRARVRSWRISRGSAKTPVPVQVVVTPPAMVPGAVRPRLKPYLAAARRRTSMPSPDQPAPPQIPRARVKPPVRRRAGAAIPPPPAGGVWQALRARLRIPKPARGRTAQPVPTQVTVTPPAYPPQPVRTRLKFGRLWRGRAAAPVPPQIVVTPPAYPPQLGRARSRLLRYFRGRAAAPVPPQVTATAPAYVPGRARPAAARQFAARRGHTAAPPTPQAAPPLIARIQRRIARLLRGEVRPVVPPQIVIPPPPYPPQKAGEKKTLWGIRHRRAPLDGWIVGSTAHSCDTPRPSAGTTSRPGSGTTVRPTGTTSRPDSGITVRPDAGDTNQPCT